MQCAIVGQEKLWAAFCEFQN
jgi:hypothetical protein